MKQKHLSSLLLCPCLLSVLPVKVSAADNSKQETPAVRLRERGIVIGDGNGGMNLDPRLTRAQLVTVLTRPRGNPEHVQVDQAFYTGQYKSLDVPEWVRPYVGYCYANGLMVGYDIGTFDADDGVTPAAACTIVLRYMDLSDIEWDYSTTYQTALDFRLTSTEVAVKARVTRDDLTVMLCRALGNTDASGEHQGETLSRNADGSINSPVDGSQCIPRVDDVIRCDDGTSYTITDVSRWDESVFASDPTGPLSEPTCDWSLLEQPELPKVEVRHFQNQTGNHLRILNLYEARWILYILYNAIEGSSTTWENEVPKLTSKGNQLVHINLSFSEDLAHQIFWPWRESEIIEVFNGAPGTYSMQAWDVYKDD